jgi:hypothetical protein
MPLIMLKTIKREKDGGQLNSGEVAQKFLQIVSGND